MQSIEEQRLMKALEWKPCLYAQTLGKGTCPFHCKGCYMLNMDSDMNGSQHNYIIKCKKHHVEPEKKITMDAHDMNPNHAFMMNL